MNFRLVPIPLTFAAASGDWPDNVDGAAVMLFLVLTIAAPVLGYWFMVLDIRAYLRALRGALIIVKNHLPYFPDWAKEHTPGCIRSLGLRLPCTEADIKRAYRRLAEELHPDRGGDRQRFLLLQRQFEEATRYIQEKIKP